LDVKKRSAPRVLAAYSSFTETRQDAAIFNSFNSITEVLLMSVEDDNKAVVGRWFTSFWGKTCDLSIVDELAAPDMLLHYSLHEPAEASRTSSPS